MSIKSKTIPLDTADAARGSHNKLKTFAYFIALGLFAALFLARGPLYVSSADDLSSPYVSSLRFLQHRNPYPPAGFRTDWTSAGAPQDASIVEASEHSIYPPLTLSVFAPFTRFRWLVAVRIYIILCSVLYGFLVFVLTKILDTSAHLNLKLAFACYCLALSPVHSGIRHANLSTLACLLSVLGLILASRNFHFLSAMAVAISFSLKPTAAIAAILVFAIYRHKVALLSCFILISANLIYTVGTLTRYAPTWRTDYQSNLKYMFGPDGGASFITKSSGRFDGLSLHVPIYELTQNVTATDCLTWGGGAILAITWAILSYRKNTNEAPWNWNEVGAILMISLLPIYQRNYNALVFVVPLLWAFGNIDQIAAKGTIILGIPFCIPGEALLRRSGLYDKFASSRTWNAFAMSHLTWIIFIIVCIMLWTEAQKKYGTPRCYVSVEVQ